MKRIANLLRQDFLLLLRNALFWVMTASLVLIVVAVNWLIPGDTDLHRQALVVYGLSAVGAETAASPEQVYQAVRNEGAVGVISDGNGQLTVVHGGLSEQAVAALLTQLIPPADALPSVEQRVLRPAGARVPANLRLTPLFISFEAVVLGFLLAAVLLLGEKQEAVLSAYRVSPGGAGPYVVSKALLFGLVGTVYALLMAWSTVGFRFNLGQFLLLSALGSLLYTLLGLSLAVFFPDIASWFFVAVLLLALNMLPMVSFAAPTFSPAWMRLIPSYSSLFAYQEALFPTGKSLGGTYLLLALETVVALGFCTLLVRRRLLKSE